MFLERLNAQVLRLENFEIELKRQLFSDYHIMFEKDKGILSSQTVANVQDG